MTVNILGYIFKKIKKLRLEKSSYNDFKYIGSNVILGENTSYLFKERIELGNYIYIGNNTFLDGRGQIYIGDYSIISSEVVILSSQHNYKNAHLLPYDEVDVLSTVKIGKCCWIGIRAIILPGVQLDDGCIVGAGSVVTKSFSKGSIVAGNPATLISIRDLSHYDDLESKDLFYMVYKQRGLSKVEKVIPTKGNIK